MTGLTLPRLLKDKKSAVRQILPLAVRKPLAAWIGRQEWLPARHWWSVELVRDLAQRDVTEFHRFLWSNHLGYAETYEVERRFGEEQIHPTRQILFTELQQVLREQGIDPARDVGSVYEVGCSMGYLLRHLELNVFPAATVLEGSDIDEYATRAGSRHLAKEGSRVSVSCGNMQQLDSLMAGKLYDVILCAGVLMYLPEDEAAKVVEQILDHSSGIVAFAGLAHPTQDNSKLSASEVRGRDETFIHNIDALVERAAGSVIHRRWDGDRSLQGNTIYFVFCVPARDVAAVAVS